MTDNWIVITSINPPSSAVRAFAKMPDWHVVVVGDEKTPKDWACENVTYLPIEDHDALGLRFTGLLPRNHYSRKMIGYLYAMRQGAEVIADADDDTLPGPNWECPKFDGPRPTLYGPPKFVNVYKYFAKDHVWPRGFPLRYIHQSTCVQQGGTQRPVGVWQSLVDGEPDVDAIYRLTVGWHTYFQEKLSPIVLEKGTFCPFNSQNTFWRKETFPLMYLPTSVNPRFSDILRGYVAQPVMWALDYQLGFTTSNAQQVRNKHDLMIDFADEIPMYLRSEEAAEVAGAAVTKGRTMSGNMMDVYAAMSSRGIADEPAVEAWLDAVEVLL